MDDNKSVLDKSSTHDRIISVAIKLFSKYGFEATTTRMIVKEAGVNLSAISFYFENKESLHRECLEFIAARANEYYAPAFAEAAELLLRGTSPSTRHTARVRLLIQKHAFGKQYKSS